VIFGGNNKLGDVILIFGAVNAGKTQLFISLSNGDKTETVTSQTENVYYFTLKNKTYRYVDFPGHPSVRNVLSEKYIRSVRCLIFVIDSAESDATVMGNSAQYLYNILKECSVPILIVCNKTDLINSKNINQIKSFLINSLEKLRQNEMNNNSHADLQVGSNIFNKSSLQSSFSFEKYPISFCSISVKEGPIDDVQNFIKNKLANKDNSTFILLENSDHTVSDQQQQISMIDHIIQLILNINK